ncbi:FLICE-associated huge protein isoform X2 [Lasioglossum baleicum]
MFKRGGYYRTNNRVCKKPTFVENGTIRRQITEQISLPLSQNKHESAETDSSYNLTKSSNLPKSTLTPLTVFGERLLKRIAETQSMEKRVKQPSRFGSNNSCVTTIDGYVAESDKENGSVKEYSEKERFAATDCSAEGRNEIDSTDVAGIVDRGENDGMDRTMNIKCIKSEVKESAPRSTNKEPCEDVNNVFDKKHEHTRTSRFEYSEKYTDPRFNTYSNTGRNRYSSVEQQSRKRSHRSPTIAVQPIENDADERFAKRHCKSVERSSITTDDYRSSSVESRRNKQREDRRTNETWGDRRLRGRQPSCESSRDDRYTRSKSDKYNNYRERSVRRYDNSSDSTDCSKAAAKREFRDSRSVEKYARSINKRSDRSEDYECQSKERLRNVARRGIDKSDGEKLMNRTRHSETLKSEKATDTNKCFERSDRRRFAENYEPPTTVTKLANLSRKQQINRNKDYKSTDAKEIALDNSERRERSQDRWTNGEKPEPSVISVDATNTNNVISASTATATTNAVATCFATVVSLNKQNVENNESAENVENIEKFIRNYHTTDGNHPKNSLSSERNDTSKLAEEHESTTIHVFKDQANLKEQRDTIRSDDVKSAETNTKLEAVETKGAVQLVSQDSSRDGTKENETTSVPSLVEYEKSNKVSESNDLIDLAADKALINSRTNGLLPSSNTSNTFQISEPGCNGNVNVDGDDKDKNKGDDKIRCPNVPRDVEADKLNSNCDYSVPDITKGNDDDHVRNHESHSNVKVHKKPNDNDHKTVRNKEGASKEEGRADLAEKLDEKLENEEGKVNKGKKENSKAVTKQGPRETEKSSMNCDSTNRKNTSTNVHGKIIVFARRKKPVRLANTNANMTVLINNSLNNS